MWFKYEGPVRVVIFLGAGTATVSIRPGAHVRDDSPQRAQRTKEWGWGGTHKNSVTSVFLGELCV